MIKEITFIATCVRPSLSAAVQRGVDQVAVHPPNKFDRDLFGAHGFALAVIRAASEKLFGHGRDHAHSSLVALRLSLRKRIKMRDLRCSEQHRRRVWTGSHTCPASNASRCV